MRKVSRALRRQSHSILWSGIRNSRPANISLSRLDRLETRIYCSSPVKTATFNNSFSLCQSKPTRAEITNVWFFITMATSISSPRSGYRATKTDANSSLEPKKRRRRQTDRLVTRWLLASNPVNAELAEEGGMDRIENAWRGRFRSFTLPDQF